MFIYWFWLKNAKIIQKLRIIFAYLQFLLYFCGAKLVHLHHITKFRTLKMVLEDCLLGYRFANDIS